MHPSLTRSNWVLTLDGALVLPTNEQVPSLPAIATGLCRMPRFAGQTRRWWTVLHHSIVVACLAFVDDVIAGRAPDNLLIGAAALHDAHEALTGDVPTTWKTADLRRRQQALDRRLFAAYLGVSDLSLDMGRRLAALDQRALVAEAALVGPPGFAAAEPDLLAPTAGDLEVVERFAERFPTCDANALSVELMVSFVELVERAAGKRGTAGPLLRMLA